MGLAASQARFLGLTARKSNTEYQGQQINQQRTTLANESASLYSQLTNLTVPTPPDIINYYSTEYSFTVGEKTYTLTSLPQRSDSGYSFQVSYQEPKTIYTNADNKYDYLMDLSKTANKAEWAQQDAEFIDQVKGLYKKDANDSVDISKYNLEYINDSANNKQYYKISPNEENSNEPIHFFEKSTINDVRTEFLEGINITFSPTGDIETISNITKIVDSSFSKETNVAVQSSRVADDAAYDLAMNQYEIDYAEYEKTMSAINAKTEVIQQQDKSLELKLNQLDTEQNAISTEMDAVQKVIEKNVESTFKTFA